MRDEDKSNTHLEPKPVRDTAAATEAFKAEIESMRSWQEREIGQGEAGDALRFPPRPPAGQTWAYRDEAGQPERIVACAMILGDLVISMPKPARHGEVWKQFCLINPYLDGGIFVEGFLTSRGRFVDRPEGARVADNAHQRTRFTGPANKLFSEDLW